MVLLGLSQIFCGQFKSKLGWKVLVKQIPSQSGEEIRFISKPDGTVPLRSYSSPTTAKKLIFGALVVLSASYRPRQKMTTIRQNIRHLRARLVFRSHLFQVSQTTPILTPKTKCSKFCNERKFQILI